MYVMILVLNHPLLLSGNRMEDYFNKLKTKCDALYNIIIGIQNFYHNTNTENKRFIETTIGAAIWYLPKNNKVLFTGMISKDAINKNEKSEDHQYPRKIAATELLNYKWNNEKNPSDKLLSLFVNKYGKFNYVSKNENKRLIKFQKSNVFKSPEKAYLDAGIKLLNYIEE